MFARGPLNCLAHIQNEWPRNGILRVEVVRNVSSNYSIIDSYEKEYHESMNEEFSLGTSKVSSATTDTANQTVESMDTHEASQYLPDVEEYKHDFGSGSISNETDATPAAGSPVRRGLLFGNALSEFEMLAKVGQYSMHFIFIFEYIILKSDAEIFCCCCFK